MSLVRAFARDKPLSHEVAQLKREKVLDVIKARVNEDL